MPPRMLDEKAAVAIENARPYQDIQGNLSESVSLIRIGKIISSTLDLQTVLRLIVEEAATAMQARICTIRILQDDELSVGVAFGYHNKTSREHRIKIDERLAEIVRDKEPLIIPDLLTEAGIPHSRVERARREGVRAFLAVPVIFRGKTSAILSIYKESVHSFSEEEVRFLFAIASEAAVAIENARLHSEVRALRRLLEQQVKQSNEALTETQRFLAQAQKLAGLGQLAAGVAHEVRNPLGIINASLYYVKDILKSEKPEIQKHLKIMEAEVERARRVIENLLQFSKSSEYEMEEVDINALLEMTLDLLEKELRVNDIGLALDLKELPALLLNLDEIKQAFLNIILNATQAMPDGGSLKVATRSVSGGAGGQRKDFVEIVFKDTGVGIPEEALDNVFDPFFTTKESGTGLGLSLVYSTVKKFGGDITIESRRGKSTTVTLRLPIRACRFCSD